MKTLGWSDFHPEMNIFDALSPEAFKKLLSIAERSTVEAGSTLIRENRKGHAMYIVLSGRVRVFKTGDDDQQIELAILGSGSVFGEMALFDGMPSSATVMAAEESILLEIQRDDLFPFLQKNPEISFPLMHALIYILSARLRKANVHSTSVASSSNHLADALQDLLN